MATAIAILFHLIGLLGILYSENSFFLQATSFNLILMIVLLFYSEGRIRKSFIIFFIISFVLGFIVEIIGTQTGWLFGNYKYGDILGINFYGVPLLIGINWFLVMYGSGVLTTLMAGKFQAYQQVPGKLKLVALALDGACMATLFDWLMEPVAVKLGYWTWTANGAIPLFNYGSWFLISFVLQLVYHLTIKEGSNKFAMHLLLVQAMFFLLLRTLL